MRAAYWTDGQGDVLLTGPEHAGLPDDDLLAEGEAEYARQRLGHDGTTSLDGGRIVVGEWQH